MTFSLTEFTSKFKGGARAYLFEWNPTDSFPEFSNELMRDLKYFVKSTVFPSTSISEDVTSYQHINYKSPNKKVFEDWTLTFNMDKEAKLRMAFETWTQKIHGVGSKLNTISMPSSFRRDQDFRLLGYDLKPILNIKLYNSWPKTIGAINLDYGSQEVATFDVTFSYMYHEITKI